MIKKSYNYIDGSAARKLEYQAEITKYDVYEENEVLKAKRQYKELRSQKIKFIFSLICVFAAGLFIMVRFAMITQLSYTINSHENKYNEIRNQNAILRFQIEKGTDLEKIRMIAEERLGMKKPDKSQIVYISVPKNDHTMVMDSGSKETESGIDLLEGFLQESIAGFASLLNR